MFGTALFIGRFQPFHLGHFNAFKQILKDNPSVIIFGIGSSEAELTFKNPLSFYERKKIIQDFLRLEFGLQKNLIKYKQKTIKILIYPIPDFGDAKKWTNYILTKLPYFDILYTGNSYTESCFQHTDKKIKILEIEECIKAINIRHLILQNLDWQHLVPKSVAKNLLDLEIQKRLEEINKFEEEISRAQFFRDKNKQKKLEAEIVLIEKQTDWEFLEEHGLPNMDYLTKVQNLKKWHILHQETKQKWLDFFLVNNISYKILKAYQVDEFDFDNVKIIITLGGDGTFLDGAKKTKNQPIIGINSQPHKSVGKLTPFFPEDSDILFAWVLGYLNSKQDKFQTSTSFKKELDQDIFTRFKFETFQRLGLKINQKTIPSLAVNEIYVGQPLVYKTSKIRLEIENEQTEFLSNGIIISTFQGSTAFYASTKGKLFKEDEFAYSSLLSYKIKGNLRANQVLKKDQKVLLIPERANHSVVFDGDEKREIKLRQGDEVEVFLVQDSALKVLSFR